MHIGNLHNTHPTRNRKVGINVRIKVENAYADGHESEQIHTVDDRAVSYALLDGLDALDDLLYEYTGDGYGIGRGENGTTLDAYYTVTVLESPRSELVGYVREWD